MKNFDEVKEKLIALIGREDVTFRDYHKIVTPEVWAYMPRDTPEKLAAVSYLRVKLERDSLQLLYTNPIGLDDFDPFTELKCQAIAGGGLISKRTREIHEVLEKRERAAFRRAWNGAPEKLKLRVL